MSDKASIRYLSPRNTLNKGRNIHNLTNFWLHSNWVKKWLAFQVRTLMKKSFYWTKISSKISSINRIQSKIIKEESCRCPKSVKYSSLRKILFKRQTLMAQSLEPKQCVQIIHRAQIKKLKFWLYPVYHQMVIATTLLDQCAPALLGSELRQFKAPCLRKESSKTLSYRRMPSLVPSSQNSLQRVRSTSHNSSNNFSILSQMTLIR